MRPLSPNKPHLIIMVGIPGAGKSFFAEHFSETFKAPLINSNKLRKEIFEQPNFSKSEDNTIRKISFCILDELFKTKQTIIYEGLTESKIDRANIAKKARDAGYTPMFLWMQIEPSVAKKRTSKKYGDNQILNTDQFEAKLKQFNSPSTSEKIVVISGMHTYASQLKIVLKNLVEPRPPINTDRPAIERPQRDRSYLIR